jgi:hypothetical protein
LLKERGIDISMSRQELNESATGKMCVVKVTASSDQAQSDGYKNGPRCSHPGSL